MSSSLAIPSSQALNTVNCSTQRLPVLGQNASCPPLPLSVSVAPTCPRSIRMTSYYEHDTAAWYIASASWCVHKHAGAGPACALRDDQCADVGVQMHAHVRDPKNIPHHQCRQASLYVRPAHPLLSPAPPGLVFVHGNRHRRGMLEVVARSRDNVSCDESDVASPLRRAPRDAAC